MAQELWIPTDQDHAIAEEAYIHYATGVAILNNPVELQPVHAREFTPENVELIIVHAEDLMLSGLHGVVRAAHPPEIRGNLCELEDRFDEGLSNILTTASNAYKNQGERLTTLNSALPALRPNPLTEESLYRYICHSRLNKITTLRLIGALIPHPELYDALERRTLENLHSLRQKRKRLDPLVEENVAPE